MKKKIQNLKKIEKLILTILIFNTTSEKIRKTIQNLKKKSKN